MSSLALACACSFAAAVDLLVATSRPSEGLERLGRKLLIGSLGLYLGGLAERINSPDLMADIFGISATCLVIAGLYTTRFRRQNLAWATAAAMAAVLFGIGAVTAGQVSDIDQQMSILLVLHIGFVTSAAGFLAALGIMAALYLVKEKGLRDNPTGWSLRLPGLGALDRIQLRSLQASFVLLTIGAGLGALMILSGVSASAGSDILAVVTAVIWCVLASMLYLRLWRGWRGHSLAVFSGISVIVLLATVFISFGSRILDHG